MQANHPSSLLFTDLYELTMAQAYLNEGFTSTAVFELFFREMPASRNYIIAAGISDVLDYLENLHATEDDITFLRQSGQFLDSFLDYLRNFRFSGDVYAMAEGTPVFPHEPLLQIVAPIIEAQIIETFIINQIHFQTIVASKAARIICSAPGRKIIDFGSRRAHGKDAALKVAKVSYLVGASGTSNVLAGRTYAIPIFGTMAHSYIQAHEREIDAFRNFLNTYPETTLLVDTYDTLEAIKKIIQMSREWKDRFPLQAVRLDSGDLAQLATQSRQLLDQAGLNQIKIFASGDLDEYKISQLIEENAPIDSFGVGTKMAVCSDAPALDMVYKLVEYAGKVRTKLSKGKLIYPGRKQVFRTIQNGRIDHDLIGLFHETQEGDKLLQAAMIKGKRTPLGTSGLEEDRQRSLGAQEMIPKDLLSLTKSAKPYPISFTETIQQELLRLKRISS